MVDFNALLDRKYANMEEATRGENQLRDAQAQGILGSLPSENALRSAQAFSTTEQGKTLGPLAASSIAATTAQTGQTQAQTGLIGAQTGLVGAQTQDALFGSQAASPFARLNYLNQLNSTQNFGLNANTTPLTTPSLTPATGSLGPRPTDPNDPRNRIRGLGGAQGFSAGTANVQPKGQAKGQAKGQVKGQPKGQAKGSAPPMAAKGPPVAQPMGGPLNLHSVMAHAVGALHAAGGATDVTLGLPNRPEVGMFDMWPQLQTMQRYTPAGAPIPLQRDGYGNIIDPGFGLAPPGGGYSRGFPAPYPNPTPEPHDITNTSGGVRAAGGAVSVKGPFPAKKGAAEVPGKGPSNKDSVPAVLAPGEAVLNAGAAAHMGRGAIATLNALGAHAMARAGIPPETPPTAHGVARGAPETPPKAPARGMPPAKAKPVAAGAKGK